MPHINGSENAAHANGLPRGKSQTHSIRSDGDRLRCGREEAVAYNGASHGDRHRGLMDSVGALPGLSGRGSACGFWGPPVGAEFRFGGESGGEGVGTSGHPRGPAVFTGKGVQGLEIG